LGVLRRCAPVVGVEVLVALDWEAEWAAEVAQFVHAHEFELLGPIPWPSPYLNYDRLGIDEVHKHLANGDRDLHRWLEQYGIGARTGK
jgi:hypothetical protein